MAKTIAPDSFAMICFLVLMQNGGGLIDKSPDYIREKTHMLRAGIDAFAYLDIYNMRKAMHWCRIWHVEPPQEALVELARQEGAMKSLREKGIFF